MIGPITLYKIHEVIPVIPIFNDTSHLATGLFGRLHLRSENEKKQNIDFPKSLKLDKIPQNTLTQFSSWPGKQPGRQMKPRLSIPHAEFRGKTTARPCDINAHVAGTTTINIEILSDTSKLLRNEPLYLQGMETYILYASNVIFPHFGVSIQIIFHPRHRPHSASVRPDSQGPMFVQRQSSSRGGGQHTGRQHRHSHTHTLMH